MVVALILCPFAAKANDKLFLCITEIDREGFVYLDMEATAYTAGYESTGKTPEHPAYGITKSGTTVQEGRTIAVDPDVIPLGADLEIWYGGIKMGDYIAEDVGGLIKGCIIDIFIEDLDRALEWGRRNVILRIHNKHLNIGRDLCLNLKVGREYSFQKH